MWVLNSIRCSSPFHKWAACNSHKNIHSCFVFLTRISVSFQKGTLLLMLHFYPGLSGKLNVIHICEVKWSEVAIVFCLHICHIVKILLASPQQFHHQISKTMILDPHWIWCRHQHRMAQENKDPSKSHKLFCLFYVCLFYCTSTDTLSSAVPCVL